ncbi:MAG: hypothetical protein KC445_10685 [Anaerolineales bacterium]|nr:hypothetical protein [Anaerolineales bacterium]
MNLKRMIFSLRWVLLLMILMGMVACQGDSEETADLDVQATVDTAVSLTVAAQTVDAAAEAVAELPSATPIPTATLPPPPTLAPPATSTPLPTAVPTETPAATETPTEEPTAAPTAVPPTTAPVNTQPPPPPTTPAEPVFSGNLLANGSFEDGWYNLNGAPEFQLPNSWILEFDSGPTGFGTQPWDIWFPPETRVLPYYQLPENERGLFIRDGEYTIKAFKGNGPISLRLLQDIALPAGTYVFRVYVFPDLVASYDGGKQYAGDPSAGEVRFISPSGGTDWQLFGAGFGTWGVFEHTFTIDTAQTVRIGVGMRGRYGLASNGFFIDDWSLQRVEN